jgi:hypothetical protein
LKCKHLKLLTLIAVVIFIALAALAEAQPFSGQETRSDEQEFLPHIPTPGFESTSTPAGNEEAITMPPLGAEPESAGGLEPVAPPKPEAPNAKQYTPKAMARLQALDKITARVSTLDIAVDDVMRFGTLVIAVRSCQVAVDEEAPENAAFVEISEEKPSEAIKRVFTGWMFASSPALSAVEHPVYDVWLLACKNPSTNAGGNAP